MVGLRLLKTGKWNKPPVLTAARRLVIEELGRHASSEPLGEMAEFVNGTSYRNDLLSEDGASIIRISNMTDPTSTFLRTTESFEDRYKVKHGDLLVSWSASFKSIIWPGPAGVLNQHIFRIRERGGNNKNYIRHAIEAVFDEMQQKVVGIGMMHLRRQDFVGHLVPCPSYEIQREVAEYLDWIETGSERVEPSLPAFLSEQRRIISRIDHLNDKLTEAQLLRRAAQQQSAILLSDVADKLFESQGDTRVGDFVRIQSGYAFKSAWFAGEGVRLVRNVNIGHGEIDWSDTARIPEERRAEFKNFDLSEGDVLVSLDRPIISTGVKVARVAKRDLPSLLLQRVGRACFLDEAVMPEYFYAWLRSRRFTSAIDPGRSNGVPHISPKDIERIPFSAPERDRQREVLAWLDQIHAAGHTLKNLQAETTVELDALMPSILSKAFRGEL